MNHDFENILQEFGPAVFRLALAKTGDPHMSDDIQAFPKMCAT